MKYGIALQLDTFVRVCAYKLVFLHTFFCSFECAYFRLLSNMISTSSILAYI